VSDNNGVGAAVVALFMAGPTTGIFLYSRIKSKYRNRDARYKPETVVKYEITKLEVRDTALRQLVSRSPVIAGDNHRTPHVRVADVAVVKE